MKLFKRTAPPEVALQKLESLMKELDISIECHNDIYVNYAGHQFEIVDESGENIQVLPRNFDDDRMGVIE